MQSFTINAVVLREVQYKDNDTIITLLTAEKGLMTATAKGILKMLSKNRPAIQLFCYSEFELAKYGNQYIVKSAFLKEQFYTLRNDIEKYALACYAAQAACNFCTEENDETNAFRLVLNTLAALNDKKSSKPLWQIKAAFELKLCAVCGFMPELYTCALCGCECNEENLCKTPGKYFFFSLFESSVYCKNCMSEDKNSHDSNFYPVKISYTALCAMRYICTSSIQRFLSFKVSEDIASELSDICERYLLFLAEKSFDTLKYYKSLTQTTANISL